MEESASSRSRTSSSTSTSRRRKAWNGWYHSRSQCVWGTMATVRTTAVKATRGASPIGGCRHSVCSCGGISTTTAQPTASLAAETVVVVRRTGGDRVGQPGNWSTGHPGSPGRRFRAGDRCRGRTGRSPVPLRPWLPSWAGRSRGGSVTGGSVGSGHGVPRAGLSSRVAQPCVGGRWWWWPWAGRTEVVVGDALAFVVVVGRRAGRDHVLGSVVSFGAGRGRPRG